MAAPMALVFDSRIDDIVRLFSTDWFYEHWSVIGIRVEEPSKRLFQLGCRDIVLDFVEGEKDYYLIDFREQRIRRTETMFNELMGRCNLSAETTNRIRS